jgi:hypothetical protein
MTITLRSLLVNEADPVPLRNRPLVGAPPALALIAEAAPVHGAGPKSLVYVTTLEFCRLYWVPQVSALIVRVIAGAKLGVSFERTVRKIAAMSADIDAQAIIVDLCEALVLARETAAVEQALRQQIAASLLVMVSPSVLTEGAQSQDCFRHRTVAGAIATLRQLTSAAEPADLALKLMRARNAGVIAGNSAGCAYWLPKTRTLALIWSGEQSDPLIVEALLEAVTTFAEYLQIEHVICDIHNFTQIDGILRARLHTFFESIEFCDVSYFVLVGEPRPTEFEGPHTAVCRLLRENPKLQIASTFLEALLLTGEATYGQTRSALSQA